MRNFVYVFIALVVGVCTSFANADIVYQVDRTIDQGTITGFITTDGTIGTLATANIIDWELTLTAPNLAGGSPDVISFATQFQTNLFGTTTTATATTLSFDISGASGIGFFLLQGDNFNFLCLETDSANCTGAAAGERMGRNANGSGVAQTAQPTGNFVFARNADPIVYQVDRTIDQGTVTGFITTDGTLGTLTSANIIDWELTLTAPNLLGGSPDVISFATQNQTNLSGTTTTATATTLSFDISGASGIGFFLLEGDNFNFWCLETDSANCTGVAAGERMGGNTNGNGVAQTAQPTGNFVFASVATSIVYLVDRTIDQGTVTGFITTDGTIGTLATANIIDWELTLTAPNLLDGPTTIIDFANQVRTVISGTTTTATATTLSFDISGASGIGFFLLDGAGFTYWCIETDSAGCTGVAAGERMGRDADGSAVAQTGQPTGNFVFASTVLPPICPADLTGDGNLNFFDVSAFLSAFSAGDPVADFNGDGQFNFFDVSAFLAAFSAGCQ